MKSYLVPLVIGVSLSLGYFLGNRWLTTAQPYSMSSGTSYSKLNDILSLIDQRYVDSVDAEALFEETIGDMLHKLDPHSNYIAARDMKEATEQLRGEFGGVGVRFFIIRDTICITYVIPGSPSEIAGLKAGDKILSIDARPINKSRAVNDSVMSMLKGTPQTEVALKVLRNGQKLNKRVIRGAIPIASVSACHMMNATTGFIKIESFSLTTADEFRAGVQQLVSKGMRKLVLDLRNNGGGVLQSAIEIADEFLPQNKLLLTTKGEHSRKQDYYSTPGGMLLNTPLVVLVNENSASASEILAGALQDNDRGTIVGRRSFGKGLVQEDLQLRDGSSLRLTIARYYTPTGRCIQRPYNGKIEDYYHDQEDRYENGELYAPDTTKFADSLKYKTPKGKVVYGGGGIMPDIFVPLDTTGNSWYYTQIRYLGVMQAFAFDFVQQKRNQWNNASTFNRQFQVDDRLIEQLVTYADKYYEVKPRKQDIKISKQVMKEILKAEIARQIWVEDGYYQVINGTDKEVMRALSILK